LARTTKSGNLGPGGWLSEDGYYMTSTLYNLTAAVATVQLLRRRLTLVDFNLDPQVKVQYELARRLHLSFTDDFVLAGRKPELPYHPDEADDMPEKARENPTVYARQGLYLGKIDRLAEGLLVEDKDLPSRLMSYGQFEKEYEDPTSPTRGNFKPLQQILFDFHPERRPVLWRVFIAQAHLYQALLRTAEWKFSHRAAALTPLGPMAAADRQRLDWRRDGKGAGRASDSDKVVLEEPFDVALGYLKSFLPRLFPDREPHVTTMTRSSR
jgi:hypothetical protein